MILITLLFACSTSDLDSDTKETSDNLASSQGQDAMPSSELPSANSNDAHTNSGSNSAGGSNSTGGSNSNGSNGGTSSTGNTTSSNSTSTTTTSGTANRAIGQIDADQVPLAIDTWNWSCAGDEWALQVSAVGPATRATVHLISGDWSQTIELELDERPQGSVWQRFTAEIESNGTSCIAHDAAAMGVALVQSDAGVSVCKERRTNAGFQHPLVCP